MTRGSILSNAHHVTRPCPIIVLMLKGCFQIEIHYRCCWIPPL